MNNLKIKKGDIQVLVNPLTKQCEWVNPSNIEINIGKVDYTETGKKVTSGSPKKIGIYLSEKEKEIKDLQEENKELRNELSKFKATYKKNMKAVTKLLEILVPQMELNSLELNDILTNMEDKTNEE